MLWTFLLGLSFPRSPLLARLRRYQITEKQSRLPPALQVWATFPAIHVSNAAGAMVKLSTVSENKKKLTPALNIPLPVLKEESI